MGSEKEGHPHTHTHLCAAVHEDLGALRQEGCDLCSGCCCGRDQPCSRMIAQWEAIAIHILWKERQRTGDHRTCSLEGTQCAQRDQQLGVAPISTGNATSMQPATFACKICCTLMARHTMPSCVYRQVWMRTWGVLKRDNQHTDRMWWQGVCKLAVLLRPWQCICAVQAVPAVRVGVCSYAAHQWCR